METVAQMVKFHPSMALESQAVVPEAVDIQPFSPLHQVDQAVVELVQRVIRAVVPVEPRLSPVGLRTQTLVQTQPLTAIPLAVEAVEELVDGHLTVLQLVAHQSLVSVSNLPVVALLGGLVQLALAVAQSVVAGQTTVRQD